MTRRFIVTFMLYAVAITTPFLAVSHSVGERKADEDAQSLARCHPREVPYEVTQRPEFIRAVRDCISRAEDRRQSRWGPWKAWGGGGED